MNGRMNEVNPKETTRAYAFEMWMDAPMPMVTFFKTLDVTRLTRLSRRSGLKFNMLMCWCIGRAASSIKEFHMLPVGRKLIQYDNIAVNTIVANREGEIWGKYKRRLWKRTLTVSFQFHHTQMDGAHAARFLEDLQKGIRELYRTFTDEQ